MQGTPIFVKQKKKEQKQTTNRQNKKTKSPPRLRRCKARLLEAPNLRRGPPTRFRDTRRQGHRRKWTGDLGQDAWGGLGREKTTTKTMWGGGGEKMGKKRDTFLGGEPGSPQEGAKRKRHWATGSMIGSGSLPQRSKKTQRARTSHEVVSVGVPTISPSHLAEKWLDPFSPYLINSGRGTLF